MPNLTMMTQVNSTDPLGGGLGARKPRAGEIAKRDAEIAAKEAAAQRAYSFEKIVHATEKQMRQEAASGRASGSAPLGNSGNPGNPTKLKECGAGQKLDERGYIVKNYLVQAAAAEAMSQEIEDWWKVAYKPETVEALWPKFAGTSTDRISSSTPAALEAQTPAAERVWPNDFWREIADQGCNLLGVFNDRFGVEMSAETLWSLARLCKMRPREYLANTSLLGVEGDEVWFNLPLGRRAFLRKATPKAS